MLEHLRVSAESSSRESGVDSMDHFASGSLHVEGGVGHSRHSTAKRWKFTEQSSLPVLALVEDEKEKREFGPFAQARSTQTREMLVGELAFALMISMAGITHVRRAHQVSEPPESLEQSEKDSIGNSAEQDERRLEESDSEQLQPTHRRSFPFLDLSAKLLPTQSGYAVAPVSPLIKCDSERVAFFHDECFYWNQFDLFEDLAMSNKDDRQIGVKRWNSRCFKQTMPATSRTVHRVEMEDTFNVLARRYFEDSSVASLIADINLGRVKETIIEGKRIVQVKLHQEILLPGSDDLKQFYHARKTMTIRPVVTIIEPPNSLVSVDTQLANICGPKSMPVSGV
jgi:hypothetical protein